MARCVGFCWLAVISVVAGCESLNLSRFLVEYRRPHAAENAIEQHRGRFLRDRDPESFHWLLTNSLENGMTPREIDRALGESGERIEQSQEYKTDRRDIHQTDIAYKWGPDSEGRSVVLFFRDGRLIHYRPQDLAAMAPADRL